ncbi:YceI family protein [Luteimonas sp. BDR2-5]|uniref:YceI family protein n=1 Tax=Proluteimonas luteida TaxID=2878685 RepID=UPI001E2CC3A1|nr:YceI family protein [Luteimonas sp. BDR2-5]MCD9028029.1 YceI family protein [Luteimonas sp. BDR2-5]
MPLARTPWRPRPGLRIAVVALALLAAGSSGASSRIALDTALSQIGFTLKTRWGQTLEGHFPSWHGEIVVLDDGRHQVRLLLPTREVEISGSRNFTRITRGPGFFDAERYPEMLFVSDPYPGTLARDGGEMAGVLSIRGVRQRETFTIAASECVRPALDCDVVGQGNVRRSRYAMDRWSYALSDEVRFTLRIRAAADPD